MKKNHYMIVDTETTQDGLVADFGAIVCDKRGTVVNKCAVLINGIYNDSVNHPLFFTSDPSGIWSKAGQDRRYKMYQGMIDSGQRTIASVAAVNRWLERVSAEYNPVLTAYNLPFDLGKCSNTNIDLSMFDRRFCLWAASYSQWATSKAYRHLILQSHGFNPPTKQGNMTFKTNAETMARFVLGNPLLPDEPHTALEDALEYELPILRKLLESKSLKKILSETLPYNWRSVQVRDWFTVS